MTSSIGQALLHSRLTSALRTTFKRPVATPYRLQGGRNYFTPKQKIKATLWQMMSVLDKELMDRIKRHFEFSKCLL